MVSSNGAVEGLAAAPDVQGALSPPEQVRETALRDDPDLVEQVRRGDAEAYETVFRTFVPRLCDYAFRYLQSRDEAEDVVQAVFAKVWNERAALVVRGTLAQFLYLAVRNLAIDRLRRAAMEHRWGDRIARGDSGSRAQSIGEPEAELERAERHAAIEQALGELPERRRQVCSLRWQEGLSYAEIAHRLGIAEQTVKNQLARAVERVSQRVRELLP